MSSLVYPYAYPTGLCESVPTLKSEASAKADFSQLRYAQCWEDAETLMEAANIKPTDRILSICSAGDNTLALLAANPAEVVAVDLSIAQLAALELRVAAIRELPYEEVLEFLGYRQGCADRKVSFERCKKHMTAKSRSYWEHHIAAIEQGVISSGRFEKYFQTFRERILPLVHSKKTVSELLESKSKEAREEFHESRWNTLRWRLLFRVFFCRFTMGLLGRDRSFFEYVNICVSKFLLEQSAHALIDQNPSKNLYLRWILTGCFGDELPIYLRPENFATIRSDLHKLKWYQSSVEEYLETADDRSFNIFNLSDMFEYVSKERYVETLKLLVRKSAPEARLIYWNMLATRCRPTSLSDQLRPMKELSDRLYKTNKTFFYCRLVIEEVIC